MTKFKISFLLHTNGQKCAQTEHGGTPFFGFGATWEEAETELTKLLDTFLEQESKRIPDSKTIEI